MVDTIRQMSHDLLELRLKLEEAFREVFPVDVSHTTDRDDSLTSSFDDRDRDSAFLPYPPSSCARSCSFPLVFLLSNIHSFVEVLLLIISLLNGHIDP